MSAYRPYPKYKPSGVEWLGDVPVGWEVKPLKFAATLLTKKSEGRRNAIGLENIESWSGRFIETESEFEGEGVAVEKGDVLFGKLRPYLAKALLVPEPSDAVGDFHAMRPNRQTHAGFLLYQILSKEFIVMVDGSTFGSKMPRASWEFVGKMPLPHPPLPEQIQIASFLDRECGKLDALQAKQERLIELLKEKRQALISHAVTRGLDPTAKLKPSGIEWLGDVPEHWRVCRVKHVAKLESGHTPSKTMPEYWEDCNIPWVSLNDTKQLKDVDYITETALQISELGMKNSSAHLLPARAVIFTRDATIGLAAITTRPMAVSQHIIAWICQERFVIPEFLLLVFYGMASDLERFTAGATLKTIGMPDVNKLSAAIPPLEEQQAIVGCVFRKFRNIDATMAKAERAIALLKERRSALISAAVTGKIDVREIAV